MSARTIFKHTRPTRWPAPAGTTVTVEARLDSDVVGITWRRDDHPEARPEHIALHLSEFDAIASAVAEARRG